MCYRYVVNVELAITTVRWWKKQQITVYVTVLKSSNTMTSLKKVIFRQTNHPFEHLFFICPSQAHVCCRRVLYVKSHEKLCNGSPSFIILRLHWVLHSVALIWSQFLNFSSRGTQRTQKMDCLCLHAEHRFSSGKSINPVMFFNTWGFSPVLLQRARVNVGNQTTRQVSESETNRYVRDLPPKGWSIIAVMMTSSVSVEYRGKTRLSSQVKGISARHKVYPYPVYIRKTCLLYSVFCWVRDGSSKSLRRIGDLMCTYYLKSPLVSHSDLLPVDEKRKLPVCQTCSERMQYSTDQRKHVSKSESISQLVFCFSPLL